ncbi:nicotinamide riboside kinase [Cladorrhinum sp. PSN332]|nr:nicotinamide riboside kinase [Cladorrhinum sp. PSN332]
MSPQKAIIIAVSGCSSSGKTTLARLLRDIFPNTFILHQDDFYKPETELPTKSGLLDWDCPAALDLPALLHALQHIRSTGTFPVSSTPSQSPPSSRRSSHGCLLTSYSPQSTQQQQQKQDFIDSKEDLNSIGTLPPSISPSLISSLRQSTLPSLPSPSLSKNLPTIYILDGFLLYTHSDPTLSDQILPLLDVKLFLLATKSAALRRRQNRDGYVTLEGFWTDPPGYVEKIVWPNYVEYHKWLFKSEEDVESGKVDMEVAGREGISVQPWGEGVEFKDVLEWAVGEVLRGVEEEKEKEKEKEGEVEVKGE